MHLLVHRLLGNAILRARSCLLEWSKKNLMDKAREKSTLKYLNLNTSAMGSVHPVWDLARTNPHTSFSTNITVKLLVQR